MQWRCGGLRALQIYFVEQNQQTVQHEQQLVRDGQQVVEQVTDDLAKIFAGIEMPARPAGAQIALQVVEQYGQQPDIAQRLQTDQAFAARLQKYVGQYTFQMQQAQNAQIGRVGTAPAQMGQINTQGIQSPYIDKYSESV